LWVAVAHPNDSLSTWSLRSPRCLSSDPHRKSMTGCQHKQKSGLIARSPVEPPVAAPADTLCLHCRPLSRRCQDHNGERRAGDLHPIRLSANRQGISLRCPLGQFTLHLGDSPLVANVIERPPSESMTGCHYKQKSGLFARSPAEPPSGDPSSHPFVLQVCVHGWPQSTEFRAESGGIAPHPPLSGPHGCEPRPFTRTVHSPPVAASPLAAMLPTVGERNQ
jgi:hypothetical protein